MTNKNSKVPALIGAGIGLATFLAVALLPALLYGGYAGVLLAGGIFGTPVTASFGGPRPHRLRDGPRRHRGRLALRGRRRGGWRGGRRAPPGRPGREEGRREGVAPDRETRERPTPRALDPRGSGASCSAHPPQARTNSTSVRIPNPVPALRHVAALLRGVRGARDVEVRPGGLLRERVEEVGRADGAAEPLAGVLHVGAVALQLLLQRLDQREPPHLLAGGARRGEHRVHHRAVRAEEPGGRHPERDHARAGERRDVRSSPPASSGAPPTR